MNSLGSDIAQFTPSATNEQSSITDSSIVAQAIVVPKTPPSQLSTMIPKPIFGPSTLPPLQGDNLGSTQAEQGLAKRPRITEEKSSDEASTQSRESSPENSVFEHKANSLARFKPTATLTRN